MKNKNNNLIASIAVFAELCNTQKDVKGILKEFIKSLFSFEKTFSMDITQATNLLNKHFDFELPEAVVKTCLNSLRKDGYLKRDEGKYHLQKEGVKSNSLTDKLKEKKQVNKK